MIPSLSDQKIDAPAEADSFVLRHRKAILFLTRLDDNRFKAEIKYRDKEGKIETRSFEGTPQELGTAIKSEKDLPDLERHQLMRFLNMPPASEKKAPAKA